MHSKRVSDSRLDVSTNSERKWSIYILKSKFGCQQPETNEMWKLKVSLLLYSLLNVFRFLFLFFFLDSLGIPWPESNDLLISSH